MKIALIASPYPLEEAPSPPLGLCYAAAACEAGGAQVIIIDYIVSQYTPEKLSADLDEFQPDVVGTNSVTMNFPQAIRIIQDAKRHRPGVVTMMGGPHVSFDVQNTLTHYPELDLIVIAEGEETIKELIPVLPDRRKWNAIAGIAFRENGRTVTTETRPLIADLDTLPLPARHLLPISRYLALGFPVSIITSRGCPNKCIFCLGRRMVGHKPRFRSPKQVVDEIEQILAYGFTWINIADDLFTASKTRVQALCDEITRRGVRFVWSAFARVNTVDTEMLATMKAAGGDS
ncbi:MAG: cobalamin B12-binding domain-containing protein, partial [Desulfobacterales bacterium]|nr:cobalamin B12-binding domain-containing protein [Desulfobacterales bacterium]